MNVDGKHYRTIWVKPDDEKVIQIIDQTQLPHKFSIENLETADNMAAAIKEMHVRGAGLIGAAAGYGMYLAALVGPEKNFDAYIIAAGNKLKATRPTAVNLAWAVDRQLEAIATGANIEAKIRKAFLTAGQIADEDAQFCRRIGVHGLKIIEEIYRQKKETVNILTHCNAGWLAFVDYGSATAPMYAAFEAGIPIKIWVDETRPWNQGAKLTAWELGKHGIEHELIADNTGGLLMQTGQVDMVITGADRVTYTGDAANKIGTYLKALAAKDNNVPFYVALPSSTFDWKMRDGVKEIPIEERGSEEVKYVHGLDGKEMRRVLIAPAGTKAKNYGFDVTPRRLITGLITERGICEGNEESILKMFPEHKK